MADRLEIRESTNRIDFELCAESMQAVRAAQSGGAHRIELCSALSEGGLTPSHALLHTAVRQSEIPVHILLRPRGGDFVYSDAEFALMEDDLLNAQSLGAQGFVLGLLDRQGRIDVVRTRRLVDLANAQEVTFHRAFDCVRDEARALEEVIGVGCRRLLTSGGRPNVLLGAEALRALRMQAAGRIVVAAGGGLRLEHAEEVARRTGLKAFHGSVRRPIPSSYACVPGEPDGQAWSVEPEDIRAMISSLERGTFAEPDGTFDQRR